jgi:hypothetical protein
VYNNELSGTVPTQLGRLTEMVTVFSVGQNLQVTGTIPTQLGNLVNMKSGLWLNENSQTGAIPTQFGRLGQMTASFALKKNRLRLIPTQLGQLSKMAERFYLHENSLSDSTIPTQLGKLSQLNSYFGLKSCKLAGAIPTQLGKLSLAPREQALQGHPNPPRQPCPDDFRVCCTHKWRRISITYCRDSICETFTASIPNPTIRTLSIRQANLCCCTNIVLMVSLIQL